jgi:mannobiose 2-epimerase
MMMKRPLVVVVALLNLVALRVAALAASSIDERKPESAASAQPVTAATNQASRPDPEILRARIAQIDSELRNGILAFWLEHTRDPVRGGFYGLITNDLVVHPDAPRGALLSARVLWTFSAAFRRYRDPKYLEMARWASHDLEQHFWDKEQGGFYWMITADGVPTDMRKIAYVQAFGVYALSEFYRATGEAAVRDKAVELYRLLEQHCHDHEHLGYFEEFTREWKISRDRGKHGSAMGSLDQKSQNVHIHLLEAYTNLLRAWPDEGLRRNLRELIDVLTTKVLDSSDAHLRLFLAEDWTPKSDTISFGHDIEFSWLLTESAEVLGDEALLARIKPLSVRIARGTLEQGLDLEGGVMAEADPQGVTNTFREWWPQVEATAGFLNAYQISGDQIFLRQSLRSWDFIETHLVDREHGDLYQGVTATGEVRVPFKVSFWKCPYHASRACMEQIDRLTAILAAR